MDVAATCTSHKSKMRMRWHAGIMMLFLRPTQRGGQLALSLALLLKGWFVSDVSVDGPAILDVYVQTDWHRHSVTDNGTGGGGAIYQCQSAPHRGSVAGTSMAGGHWTTRLGLWGSWKRWKAAWRLVSGPTARSSWRSDMMRR